ncbi:MAG: HetZ-related protein 2 [Limnothrix sp.]
MDRVAALQNYWQKQCEQDYANEKSAKEISVLVQWLLGDNELQWADKSPQEWALVESGIQYRYRVLQRYLPQKPSLRYGYLLKHLSKIITLRQQIQTWISLSRDRRRTVYDVLEEVIQEMLQRDRYLKSELKWIQTCTKRRNLQEAFLCTTLEEYCLRPIHNQPLISYRFVNLMRRYQRSGMTNLPADHQLRLLSTELENNLSEQTFNLLDDEAIARHHTKETFLEQQHLRQQVVTSFTDYLQQHVKDPLVVPWLQLYLQGKTQEAIALALDLPIQKIYRIRDKVKYHAIHNFAIKTNPDLVAQWLQTSLHQHQLGLTAPQWQTFKTKLTPEQQTILTQLQQKTSLQTQTEKLDYSSTQLLQQWSKIYLLAQDIRN